jgi:hypothetical protein
MRIAAPSDRGRTEPGTASRAAARRGVHGHGDSERAHTDYASAEKLNSSLRIVKLSRGLLVLQGGAN